MPVRAKICGVNSAAAVDAAVSGGAGFVGFVFYAPSPRALTPEAAEITRLPYAPEYRERQNGLGLREAS